MPGFRFYSRDSTGVLKESVSRHYAIREFVGVIGGNRKMAGK
jgi:hypothetical protein